MSEHPYVRSVAGHTAVHYGSLGQAECGADYPNMALTTVPANVTCRTCRGWLPIVAPREHDQSCEAELTSHGYTQCRCAERRNGG